MNDKTAARRLYSRRTSNATLVNSADACQSVALAGQRPPPLGKLLVILVRYTLLVCTALSFINYLGRPSDCSSIFTALWAAFAACWAFGSAIFLIRVYIIWDRSRRVLAFFLVLWIATLGGWAYDVTSYKAYTEHSIAWPDSWCVPAPDTKFRAFCWGLCLVFDFSVLTATLIKLRSGRSKKLNKAFRRRRSTSPSDEAKFDLECALPFTPCTTTRASITKQYLLHSNIAYFGIAFAVNLTCFVVELTVNDSVLSHIPSPIAFALNPVLAVRSVLVAENYIRCQMEKAEQAQAQQVSRAGIGSFSPQVSWEVCDPLEVLVGKQPASSPFLSVAEPKVAASAGSLPRASASCLPSRRMSLSVSFPMPELVEENPLEPTAKA